MLPNLLHTADSATTSPRRVVTKDAVLEVVEELAGPAGRVTPAQVSIRLQARVGLCSCKAVAMTLHRCSSQGLLKKHKISRRRVFYSLAPGGWRRLQYRESMKQGASVENREQTLFSSKFDEIAGLYAFVTVVKSRDPAARAFARFLLLRRLEGASYQEIEHNAEQFLFAQQMFFSMEDSSQSDHILAALLLKRLESENTLCASMLPKMNQDSSDSCKQELLEETRKTNEVLMDALKKNIEQQKTSREKDWRIPKLETMKIEPVRTDKTPTKPILDLEGEKSPEDFQFYPPPVVRIVISDLIRSARKSILVQASHNFLSNNILAELENASKNGINVTIVTDNDLCIPDQHKERLTIRRDRVFRTLLIKDSQESLALFPAQTSESYFGIKFSLPARVDPKV